MIDCSGLDKSLVNMIRQKYGNIFAETHQRLSGRRNCVASLARITVDSQRCEQSVFYRYYYYYRYNYCLCSVHNFTAYRNLSRSPVNTTNRTLSQALNRAMPHNRSQLDEEPCAMSITEAGGGRLFLAPSEKNKIHGTQMNSE